MITVTSNFSGLYGRDVTKETDYAWNSAGGKADFNWRMKWRTVLPAKVPRLKFQLWHGELIKDEACGEALLNLQPFLTKALADMRDGDDKREPVCARTGRFLSSTL
jgi:hypothetical protein